MFPETAENLFFEGDQGTSFDALTDATRELMLFMGLSKCSDPRPPIIMKVTNRHGSS